MGEGFEAFKRTLRSIVAIPVTPFDHRGSVDFDAYVRVIERLAEGGVKVVTANGNTSEFYALAPNEAHQAVRRTVEAAAGRMAVVSGIGLDLATALNAGREACDAGATMLMVHQPVHPYQSNAGWVAYHQSICKTFPEVGVIPYVRDPSVTGAMLRDLISACPNVVGVKYAIANPAQLASLVEDCGSSVTWICGLAEVWAPFFWIAGAAGFTSGLANVNPSLSIEMLASLQQNDLRRAMRLWGLVKPFEDLRSRHSSANNVSVVKEALAQLGVIPSAAVRPPLSELSASERADVTAILEGWRLLSPVGSHRC
jgi:4-hydroxy-tetrahydrodipicolinate synthase